MKKILLIENDPRVVDFLEPHLEDQKFQITKTSKGDDGLKLGLKQIFDLIILDVMLPGINGFDICREIRAKNVITPIIILTERSDEIDKVLGLESGADDYITKPFGVRELIARVRACLRRREMHRIAQPKDEHPPIVFEGLEIDQEKRMVKLYGNRVNLTPKEFDLLLILATHPGKSYSREQLLEIVWRTAYNGYGHNVNSHINRLRSKIEIDVSNPRYILTTWGIGYRFADR